MSDIPCKNCLLLGSCCGKLTFPTTYSNVAVKLLYYDKTPCSLLREYAKGKSYSSLEFSPYKIEELTNFLTL